MLTYNVIIKTKDSSNSKSEEQYLNDHSECKILETVKISPYKDVASGINRFSQWPVLTDMHYNA